MYQVLWDSNLFFLIVSIFLKNILTLYMKLIVNNNSSFNIFNGHKISVINGI